MHIFGKLQPLILIPASNNTQKFSIQQFANDTAGLLDSLKMNNNNNNKPVDILGVSLGGFIAQEFALSYPQKVERLLLYASLAVERRQYLHK
jgi:pimeloyl-ACP methyl ester carboxylesterase